MARKRRRDSRGFGPVSDSERREADLFYADLLGIRVLGEGEAEGEHAEAIASDDEARSEVDEARLELVEATEDDAAAETTGCAPPPPVPTRCTGLTTAEVLDCFDYNSSTVLPRHDPAITHVAMCIILSQSTATPINALTVVGHTDATGSAASNLTLGQARADAVKAAIEAKLRALTSPAPTVAITTRSEGLARPLGPGRHGPSRRVVVGPVARFARPPSLPACSCDLGFDGEQLRARLSATIARGLTTTSPHDPRPDSGRVGPTPIFTGDYDYHSAVHGQWARLSLARVTGDAATVSASLADLTEANLTAERGFLVGTTPPYEMPYGRAWLVLLLSEVAAQPGRNTAALQTLRQDAERELLGWLEANRSRANNPDVGQHRSWLFALLLLQMSGTISSGASARVDSLYNTEVAAHRTAWRRYSGAPDDFLDVPSIVDTLDLLRGQPAQRTASNMPASGVARLRSGHDVGIEITRLWPIAILARTDAAACTLLRDRLREWLRAPQHWEHTARTPPAQFTDNSHWTPQFLWMAMKLRCP